MSIAGGARDYQVCTRLGLENMSAQLLLCLGQYFLNDVKYIMLQFYFLYFFLFSFFSLTFPALSACILKLNRFSDGDMFLSNRYGLGWLHWMGLYLQPMASLLVQQAW